MSDKQWVAGTIIAQNSEKNSVFLVAKAEDTFSFVTTEILANRTGLASIIEYFKQKMHINIDTLKLFELTNVVIDGENVPLFVFELSHSDQSLAKMLAISSENLSWEKASTLQSSMKKWEISGVPRFEKEQHSH